ncbi:MAG TPA: shikimate kinase [Acidimicrobiales bacterium]|nr:shikimate kinase [Acidimicrobiales bacterium]
MPDHVFLVGMMGSGKTTTGRLLASRLGRVFHDSDEDVLARTGMAVPTIFATRGEAAFRAQERTVLAAAIASSTPGVIAVAGGAVLDPDSRRRIRRAGFVIWLRAAPHVLAARLGAGEGRPLLEHEPAATLRLLEARRRVVYETVADATIDVDWIEPAVVAERAERLARAWLDRKESPVGPPPRPQAPCAPGEAGAPAA